MSRYSHENPEEFYAGGDVDDDREPVKTYASQAARDAERIGYGTPDYWKYLDNHAAELVLKGVTNAFTRTLSEALQGNEGI